MSRTIWRIRALAAPAWPTPCTRCPSHGLESTGRFRVNANGARHDVWLVYRCPACGARRKRRLHHRVREGASPVPLDAYRRDDPELAERHAFELCAGEPAPYAVERPPLPRGGPLEATIVQPRFCAVRWDRFLARELGWSRTRVARAWGSGAIGVASLGRPRSWVRDAQVVSVWQC